MHASKCAVQVELPTPVVDVAWLAQNRGREDVVVVDASWHMPVAARDARAEFAAAHIEGARFFDLDACSDALSPYPHMLPSAQQFAQTMGSLGISRDTQVVIYDTLGLFSAARLWWMLRVFGHDPAKVQVLDGGLPAWKAVGLPYVEGAAVVRPVVYEISPAQQDALLVSCEHVLAVVEQGDAATVQVLDARAAARFRGEVPEPRAGLRSGHIPHSLNVPYGSVLHDDGTLLAPERLREVFIAAGWDAGRATVVSCGSGVTACVLALALARIGVWDVAVYDGSWAQWGALDHCPV